MHKMHALGVIITGQLFLNRHVLLYNSDERLRI